MGSWLWPPICDIFSILALRCRKPLLLQGDGDQHMRYGHRPMIHSVELWNEECRLVAGELGFTCGSLYTSLTGFYKECGAGTVQVLSLAGALLRAGCQCWDFGMTMTYKETLGAQDID